MPCILVFVIFSSVLPFEVHFSFIPPVRVNDVYNQTRHVIDYPVSINGNCLPNDGMNKIPLSVILFHDISILRDSDRLLALFIFMV